MKWSHLPVAGGLYDQDPDLLDRWRVIFSKRAEYEEEKEQQRKNKERASAGRTKIRGSRPVY